MIKTNEESKKCLLCNYPIKGEDELCQQCRQGENDNPDLALPESNLQELRNAKNK